MTKSNKLTDSLRVDLFCKECDSLIDIYTWIQCRKQGHILNIRDAKEETK